MSFIEQKCKPVDVFRAGAGAGGGSGCTKSYCRRDIELARDKVTFTHLSCNRPELFIFPRPNSKMGFSYNIPRS